ncbi:PIG-L family deacetylase [Iamia sp.]|uniref:PIG-L family deacetylase n=1 Tax=Iamia sp. TaxID=2722710 RepID=UPI002BE3B0C8|nr:PIG-L family deacetylase [Iamia sp.]HXH56719.1 PIG-L family deacetylase [Iamia sp.]
MATLVCFHAHPDDEAIGTGGIMALAAGAGHRVVLVCATRGERGEIQPGVLDEGEQLALRRTAEVHRSAEALGVARVEFLGYVDSGMMGEATNDEPWTFWRADVGSAAHRLAVILTEEGADALTVYDDHGGYGHPDHIQVHRVGMRAAELAGVPRVLEGTINRTAITRMIELQRSGAGGFELPEGVQPPDPEEMDLGVPEELLTHVADVSAAVGAKRASLLAHRSQVADDHFFLAMPEAVFAAVMGTEWFIGHGPVDDDGSPLRGIVAPFTAA